MSSEISSRRTACNRCKSHKLRCIRSIEDGHSRSCRRCLRIGAICVTNAIANPRRQDATSQEQPQRQSPRRERIERGGLVRHERGDESCGTQILTSASTVVEDQVEPYGNLCDNGNYQQASVMPSADSIESPKATTVTRDNALSRHQQDVLIEYSSLDILDPSLIQSLPPPLDSREECVRKLAGLHSSLVLDLNIVRSCQTADKCTGIINMPEFSQTYNFPIGRMLNASAKLLEVLQYFVSEPSRDPQRQVISCDVPTLFSICTCYTYLIRIYRIVLTSIHKSVLDKANQAHKLPPLFPGIHLGGYSLESHLDIQVNLLVQTCEMMLSKIDEAMGLKSEGQTGLLSHVEGSISFLRSMVEKETEEDHTEEVLAGDSKVSLTQILAGLRKA